MVLVDDDIWWNWCAMWVGGRWCRSCFIWQSYSKLGLWVGRWCELVKLVLLKILMRGEAWEDGGCEVSCGEGWCWWCFDLLKILIRIMKVFCWFVVLKYMCVKNILKLDMGCLKMLLRLNELSWELMKWGQIMWDEKMIKHRLDKDSYSKVVLGEH